MPDQRLMKTYADRSYTFTTMVRHNGTVVAFALDEQRVIYYSVLALDNPGEAKGELDVDFWSEEPRALPFPSELAEVGFATAGATSMPVVKKGGREETPLELAPEEVDPFLSTTARLTAGGTTLQVVSDGKHLFLFRQSLRDVHPDAVFKLSGGGSSGDRSREDYVRAADGSKVPLTRESVLCDRFVLSGSELQPCMEVRYRRSRHQSLPDSQTDTLGTEDMDGKPFFEPTQELSFIRNVSRGRFAVALLPTQITGFRRWQFFSFNALTKRIDAFNLEQGEDGLFNTQGSLLYTSPEPRYQGAILERAPGICPFTKRELVPLLPERDFAETALEFDGKDDRVEVAGSKPLAFEGKTYTLEAWVQPKALGRNLPMTVLRKHSSSANGSYDLAILEDGKVRLRHDVTDGAVTSTGVVTAGQYHHLAVTYDGTTVSLYLDGVLTGSKAMDFKPDAEDPLVIGAAHGQKGGATNLFQGVIDEVRLWERARSAAELARDKGFRLVGNEPGLVAYYRIDEGLGGTLYDQTDNLLHGEATGSPTWVTSGAPVGERPSLHRDSFVVENRVVTSGMAALLYYQQETTGSGDSRSGEPQKRQARLMLSFATHGRGPQKKATRNQYAAVLDFAVARDGRLAQVQDVARLPWLEEPRKQANAKEVRKAEEAVTKAEARVAEVQSQLTSTRAELAALEKPTPGGNLVLTLYWFTIEVYEPNRYLCVRDSKEGSDVIASMPIHGLHRDYLDWRFIAAASDKGGYRLQNRKSQMYLEWGTSGFVQHATSTDWTWQRSKPSSYVQNLSVVHAGSGHPAHQGEFLVLTSEAGALGLSSNGLTGPAACRLVTRELIEDLDVVLARMRKDLAELELALKSAEQAQGEARMTLAQLTLGAKGSEVSLRMSILSVDRRGLPVAGALLAFAETTNTPFLVDSSTGQVILYFRGMAEGELMAAYYEPSVTREVVQLGEAAEGLTLVATSAGLDADGIQVSLADGTSAERCKLTVKARSFTETWTDVPRSPKLLAEVLSGQARPEFLGNVASVSGTTLTLARGAQRSLAAGDRIQVGTQVLQVSTLTQPKATKLTLKAAPQGTLTAGQAVRFLPYDYGQAVSDLPGSTLAQGSLWLRPVPTLSVTTLANGEGKQVLSTTPGRWHGDAPGRDLSFTGQTYLASPSGQDTTPLALRGDVTLETWLLPTAVDTSSVVLACAPAARTPESSNLALALDGKTYVRFGDEVVLAEVDFTLELRLKRTKTGVAEVLLAHGATAEDGNPRLLLSFNKAGKLSCGFGKDSLTGSTAVKDTNWHHVAVTHDAESLEAVLYLDGKKVAGKELSSAYSGEGGLFLGAEVLADGTASSPSTCQVDEVRVWDHARTAQSIVSGQELRVAGDTPGLLACWHFVEEEARDIALAGGESGGTYAGTPAFVASPLAPLVSPLAPLEYMLALVKAKEKDVRSALALDGQTYVHCGDALELSGKSFTVELWLKRTRDKVPGCVLFHGSTLAEDGNRLALSLTADNKLVLSMKAGTTDAQVAVKDMEWHHYAFTHNAQSKAVVLYCDGARVDNVTRSEAYAGEGEWGLGGLGPDVGDEALAVPAACGLDEVRVWNSARSLDTIKGDKGKRMSGGEAGLLACWGFNDTRVRDATGRQFHCSVVGTPGWMKSPIDAGFKVLAGVGDSYVLSQESFPVGSWRHVAFAFQQSWGIQLRAGAWLEAAHADAFQLTGDLTLEVFLTVEALGRRQPLMGKGSFQDGSGQQAPYMFGINEAGKLSFTFEADGGRKEFLSDGGVEAGKFHRVAVVRKACNSRTEKKGTLEIAGKSVEVVESVEVKEWDDLRFYIDGREVGVKRYEGAEPLGHGGPLYFGRMAEGTDTYSLIGTLAEVRMWSRALDPAQLGVPLKPKDTGLVARWRFPEKEGNVTQDDGQSYPVRLRGASRVKSPNPAGSQAWLYVNGKGVALQAVAVTGSEVSALPQVGAGLNLGGVWDGDALKAGFKGELEEVRIWDRLRTEEQVLDNLFTRLKGEKEDLVAYYTFDLDSTRTESMRVNDNGLRGNHLEMPEASHRPVPALSTAPVSNDTARVRSALAGVRTPFHAPIDSSPAVAEYGDLQRDATGGMRGAMKRAYSFTLEGAWHLVTGYKVGNLVTEWVSQAQFAPQVIGFIEGAPPVPSENLTAGVIEYTGEVPGDLSRIEFVQADEVTTTIAASADTSMQGSLALTLGTGLGQDVEIVTAPLGLGTSTPVVNVLAEGSGTVRTELSGGWMSDGSVSRSQRRSRNMAVSLAGNWEDPKKPRADGLERRIVPSNVGFALVQSETADVYSLRLEHNRALVGYRMVPNPDIPRDWNLIPFPINPLYTKQGTLDGCIGFSSAGKVLDPDYPMASAYGEYSYFKPSEAYALKRRILREEQQELSYFRSFDTGSQLTQSGVNEVVNKARKALEGVIGELPGMALPASNTEETARAFARRNLCNTYVWTAKGGFFAETTETTDVVTESQNGHFTYNVMGEAHFGFNLEIAGVGIGLQLDASFGGGQTFTRAKSSEASRAFGLEMQLGLPANIQKYDATGPVFDTNNQPVLVPGKVDAYRFMSFYLDTDRRHFDDLFRKVIDPHWLEQSSEANALALRQARQTEKVPPCWRILHRVTFISRLLPDVPPANAPGVEKAMRAENVSSNYELIQRLEPYVREHLGSQARLAEATRQALKSYLPELVPHADQVIQYLSLYYEVPG
ncbi:LamG domain-containing protein [Pyxidicoccus sp. MSG2]|uniref:LamG domain-containing protein n=1 Tax=Pyxidicoccus sp. MSG2 TaxID=2996790 RepID=UPI00226FE422|nr:LamG domain-containing protein [Pyxidicoccus sp. MSG2]MCY1022735.1 LamG domain-containing protein [Pyxidicoccus sp. MSG2]